MPRLKTAVPKLCRHSDGKNAIVRLDGQVIYLGHYGSDSARERYDRLIAQWLAGGRRIPESQPALSLNQLILKYVVHAENYYRKNGEVTRECGLISDSLACLARLYGDTAVADFGPLRLKTVREKMIGLGWSRKYINKQVGRITRCFRWGVEEELVPETVYRALKAVAGLKKGRTTAPEHPPVSPVDPQHVKATVNELPSVVADMVQVQLLTCCRPGEVCLLSRNSLERSSDVWVYWPPGHKTEHQERRRKIFIGKKAQDILDAYLRRTDNEFLFSPADSVAEMRQKRRARRATPLHYGNRAGTNRSPNPARVAKSHYTTASYRRSIHRACDRAFPPPAGLSPEEIKSWQSAHRWSPNQLRHSSATAVRSQFGLEAAQVVLGHATANVTETYAERDDELAIDVMRRIG